MLHRAFWRAGLVDRVELFVSPLAIGAGEWWEALPDGSIASLTALTARPWATTCGSRVCFY